jgi:glycerol uptake facilitator-like aquaporin
LLHSSRNPSRFVLHRASGALLRHAMKPKHNLKQRLASEAIGTSFLVAAVVGSGIMGERLADGNVALVLLVNTIATGAALVALICTFGPISGAHLNPAVSLVDAIEGGITLPEMLAYIAAQCTGGIAGTIAAHLMFGLPWYSISTHARNGSALLFSEFVASFGLLSVIRGCSRLRSGVVPFAVASYITAAYWFTSSTSFANPAVTVARSLTNTFTGIRPVDVPLFVLAQVAGALAATFVFRWLAPDPPSTAGQVLVTHAEAESTQV